MPIEAISGIGSPDYSWYIPGGGYGDFDISADSADVADGMADDLNPVDGVGSAAPIEQTKDVYPVVEPVDGANGSTPDSLRRDHSTMRMSLEDHQQVMMGFHFMRRLELLGLTGDQPAAGLA